MKNIKYGIGYTTGVFDLLHPGHLNLLRKSKEQCEYLVVGVSTDELVENYKGKKPIYNFNERFEIISALKYVDKVVPQTDLNKKHAWDRIGFDVLFHGSDWKGSELYSQIENDFHDINVDIVYVPYTIGISSSDIRKRICMQPNDFCNKYEK